MDDLKISEFEKLKDKFYGKKIAVIGDMMLDCYFWGSVSRISPEAPVPIVEIDNEFFRFGGAANVALNILKLGGIPLPIGVIGNDNDGEIFKNLLKDSGINSKGIVVDNKRPTTAKSRVIADGQHVVRIDKESKEYLNHEISQKLSDFLKNNLDEIDAIILQDYNKGVLSFELIKESIEIAKSQNKIVTVDPKFNNFFNFTDVTVFKPNRKETEDALGIKIKTEEEIKSASEKLIDKLNCEFLLLTLGEKGLAISDKKNNYWRIPTKARKVADVSGAGDTVISTLTMALAAGADIKTASYIANYAGGLVCEEVGIIPIEIDYLFNTIKKEIL
ncbi:MAG: D-glycero-beta-D-manno-heptose-7-phosphate kinase [Melioribacteraceae bacterium]|nr:D-glycero-beta-D-manno-heptose-7-phosphate kinase [Melioribacteraceae bacterium]